MNSTPYRAGPKSRALKTWKSKRCFKPTSHRACIIETGLTYRVCTQERQISPILCWLSKVTRCYHKAFPSNPLDARMHRLSWQSLNILDMLCWLRLLEINIVKHNCDKTTFRSQHGLDRRIRVQFGLENASSTFQREMEVILSPLKWQFTLVHHNYSVILSKRISDHLSHLRLVLRLLSIAGMPLNLKKHFSFEY